MDVSKEEIVTNIEKIVFDARSLTKNELDVKYSDFKEKFFKLYENAIECEDPEKFVRELRVMLSIREDVKEGSKDPIEANVQIGEYMAKKYIYPVTGAPTSKQKVSALKKIISKHHEDMKTYDPNVKY